MDEPLSIISWLWSQPGGRTQYTPAHVNIWASRIRQNVSLPHRVAIVTDIPDGIDRDVEIISPPREFENIRIPTWSAGRPQCFRRLSMFRADAASIFGRRFVCMDLDCVVTGDLDPLFDVPNDFKIFHGTAKGRPYNGSMILMTAGARAQVYEEFNQETAVEAGKKFVGSDQAWISQVLGPDEATWGSADGVYWHRPYDDHLPSDCRVMFFVGKVKPWELAIADKDSWVAEHYCAIGRGPCLILGRGESVWGDASAALRKYGNNLPVIALAETSYYCDKVLAVARDERQADQIVRMYGHQPVWCGRDSVLSEGTSA